MPYCAKNIRAEIQAQLKAAAELSATAEAEQRELTDAEQAQFAGIMDTIGEDADGDKPPTGLKAKLATAERYERILRQNQQSNAIQTPAPAVHTSTGGRFDLPRSAMVGVQNLKAFRGERGGRPERADIEDAYASGQWLMAMLGNRNAAHWCADNGIGHYAGGIHNVMIEGANELGGVFVPTEMASRIIDLREQYGVFRQFAGVEPMGSDTKVIPRRVGGVTAYAVGETTEVTASDMKFDQVELVAKVWAALVKISRDLDEDSVVALADRVANEMAYAFAKKEDQAGFIGDGTSTYHGVNGIVNKANDGSHAGALYTAAAGNTAFSTLDLADFEGMVGQLPQYAVAGAAWYISRVGFYQSIARLLNAAGGNTAMDLAGASEPNFLGFPVRISQVMNATTTAQTSTAGLCVLGNLQQSSTLGNRRGFSLQTLVERYAEVRQIGLLGDTRVAINNHDVTDPSDTTGATTGPVVVLKTPGS